MKKLVSVVLSGALLIGTASAAYAGTSNAGTAGNVNYKDLKTTNWAYEAVNTMSQKGIVKGYNDGSFKPQNKVTYGEFIKMALVSATNEDIGNAPSVNLDTGAKQNWAKSYYDKAVELKYFGITDIRESQLNNQIPRADMALIISNILGETKIEDYNELEDSLKDVDSETKNDYDIIKSYATGIITGYQDDTFKPENTLSRAESATVIYRLVDESKRVMPLLNGEKDFKSTSGTDISSVIKNYRTFEKEKIDVGYGSLLAEASSYEFVTDMSAYKVNLRENMGTKWIQINGQTPLKLGWGNLYLMKDDNIVLFTQDGIYDDLNDKKHIDITTIEYFVFPRYRNIDHVIGIMPNPLYKK